MVYLYPSPLSIIDIIYRYYNDVKLWLARDIVSASRLRYNVPPDMDALRTFFQLNRDLLLFVYGLVFFVLGLAIALQSRRYSRLDLARSLSWLSAFGFTHALNEWGDFFIPIQATYLSAAAVQFLSAIQLLFLVASFGCLYQFGVALLSPFRRVPWLQASPVAALVVWGWLSFYVVFAFIPDLESWHHTANALARYLIGFPGGLIAAYALRRQALQRIAPLNVPHIFNTLRVAGVALFLYAIFGGLITPPIMFFPGNVLNAVTFEAAIGAPPLVFRSLIGLVLAITIIRGLEVFQVETDRRIEAMEQQQIIAAERDRIARDLHDGVIQKVYTAGLLVESVSKLAEPKSAFAGRLEKAVVVLNDAIRDLRRGLQELHPTPIEVSLADALRQFAQEPRFQSLVNVALDLDLDESESLSPMRVSHVLAIVNEAMSNVLRHARARQVKISANYAEGRLVVTIRDDGKGLPQDVTASYGLRNMRDRARLLGGNMEISSERGKGTAVTLDIPWREDR